MSWHCLTFGLPAILLIQNSLVIDTPRVRKQTRPFSATKDELAELSEGESDNDETKPKLRRNYDRLNCYGRTECFRVEKNLLVYGWDYSDCLNRIYGYSYCLTYIFIKKPQLFFFIFPKLNNKSNYSFLIFQLNEHHKIFYNRHFLII